MDWTELRTRLIGSYDAAALPRWLRIPPFPTAVTEFAKQVENLNASAASVAPVIEADAGLTVELLRHVNAAATGVKQRVKSVQRAISLLGFHRTKLLLMGCAVDKSFAHSAEEFDYDAIYAGNLQRAYFAQGVARELGQDEDLAFAGGLLADCCLPVLAAHDKSFYLGYREHAEKVRGRLWQYETGRAGVNHARMAAMLCLGWDFPDDLVCCILLHHEPLPRLAELGLAGTAAVAVRLAAFLPDWFRQDVRGLENLREFALQSSRLDVVGLAGAADQHARRMCTRFRADHAVAPMFAESA